MKKIKLSTLDKASGKFYVAIVNDDDYEYLSQYTWHLQGAYAKSSTIGFMHDVLIECPRGFLVDHINRNKLDNRKENLRPATRSQNAANIGITTKNSSGYKGVSWNSRSEQWKSRIMYNGNTISIGLFDKLEDAVIAYNKKAYELFGEFAYQNVFDKKR